MAKADPKCDYYADLELTPAADAPEIKKQFKKLGRTASIMKEETHQADQSLQLSNSIQIATLARNSSSTPSFKPSKPPMKSSPTLSRERNMTQIECGSVLSTLITLPPHDPIRLQELPLPIFLRLHGGPRKPRQGPTSLHRRQAGRIDSPLT